MSRLHRMILAAVAVLATLTWIVAARGRPAKDDAPERLLHVLGYLDTDYARFASSERGEHLAMIAGAGRLARGLPGSSGLQKDVANLAALVARGAAPAEVHTQIAQTREALVVSGHVVQAPDTAPDVTRGRALYEQHCAGCHGATGHADTLLASTLRPHPASFHDPVLGASLSPYDVTTAIRFGIEGTAMSALPSLDEQQRWDLAFYVVGLRHEGEAAGDAPSFTTSELARMTDDDLSEALFAAGIAGGRLAPTVRALRRGVTFEPPRTGPLPSARRQLELARQALLRGDSRGAAQAASTASTPALEASTAPSAAARMRDAFASLATLLHERASPLRTLAALHTTLRLLTYVERATHGASEAHASSAAMPFAGAWPVEGEDPGLVASPSGHGAPCSAPGYGPGPALHAMEGGLPFQVTHDCMYPGNDQLEIVVNVQQQARPARAEVDALLRALLEQVQRATSARAPELTHITAVSSDGATAYGRLELDADEGPQGELGVLLLVPFEAGPWAQSFAEAHAAWSRGTSPPEVAPDASGHELVVTAALAPPDPGHPRVTLAEAALQLFPWLFDFYPPKTDLQGITLRATRQGRTLLEIHVADLRAFLSMDPWPIRERMAAAGIAIEPGAPRTPAQQEALGKEYVRALARLPAGSVTFTPGASRLP